MFSNDLSRAAGLIATLLLVPACAVQDPVPVLESTVVDEDPAPAMVTGSAVEDWLELQEQVIELSSEEALAEVERIPEAPAEARALYIFALLNQQVKDYNHWITARDAFRILVSDVSLDGGQRQLAGVLERYNQVRINWYSRQSELLDRYRGLQRELDAADDDKAELQQKIQALTDLEAEISTAKER